MAALVTAAAGLLRPGALPSGTKSRGQPGAQSKKRAERGWSARAREQKCALATNLEPYPPKRHAPRLTGNSQKGGSPLEDPDTKEEREGRKRGLGSLCRPNPRCGCAAARPVQFSFASPQGSRCYAARARPPIRERAWDGYGAAGELVSLTTGRGRLDVLMSTRVVGKQSARRALAQRVFWGGRGGHSG